MRNQTQSSSCPSVGYLGAAHSLLPAQGCCHRQTAHDITIECQYHLTPQCTSKTLQCLPMQLLQFGIRMIPTIQMQLSAVVMPRSLQPRQAAAPIGGRYSIQWSSYSRLAAFSITIANRGTLCLECRSAQDSHAYCSCPSCSCILD